MIVKEIAGHMLTEKEEWKRDIKVCELVFSIQFRFILCHTMFCVFACSLRSPLPLSFFIFSSSPIGGLVFFDLIPLSVRRKGNMDKRAKKGKSVFARIAAGPRLASKRSEKHGAGTASCSILTSLLFVLFSYHFKILNHLRNQNYINMP